MRTDCQIDTTAEARCKQIPIHSPGRNAFAKRGDLVWWGIKGHEAHHVGRVIGVVTAHDLPHPYLCVAMLLGDVACEHWVNPDDVIDCRSILCGHDKLQWLFGPAFLSTPPDKARQCYELLVSQMLAPK
jgi:hypothetical protein